MFEPYPETLATVAMGRTALVARLRTIAARRTRTAQNRDSLTSIFCTPNQSTMATLRGNTAFDSWPRFRLGRARRSCGHDPQDSRDHK